MDLSNRDLAFLIWLAVVAAVGLVWRPGREAIASIAGALWPLRFLLVAFAGYVAVIVLIGQLEGLWNVGLLKETIAWFLLAGIALLFRFNRAYEGRPYYARTLLGVIGLSTAVEFYVALGSFPLLVEILLLPALVFLGLFSAVAALKPETKIVKSIADGLLAIILVAVLVGTGAYVIDQWIRLDQTELARSFALPIWLTALSLPFIFLLSLFENYKDAFGRIDDEAPNDRRARWRAKAALVLSFHLRNRALHTFTPYDTRELIRAKTWGEAHRVIAYQRAVVRVREAKQDLAAVRLLRFAGVAGTDWTGQPLDQREFKETKQALDRLAMFQRSQYEQKGRYSADLAVGILVAEKLPPDHGIGMKVRKNGRSWRAWRRTVTGWCLGVGAAEAPPDQWVYEGPEPPPGFPREDGGWKRGDVDEDTET